MRASLALVAALSLGGCGGDASRWERAEPPPLSPRVVAASFSYAGEAFVVGGDTEPCPPNAACTTPRVPPLADGAAFDSATGTWRPIAEAPVPFEFATVEVVGDTAYLWVMGDDRPGAATAFLAYRIPEDRWEELPLPPLAAADELDIARLDGRVVAVTWTADGEVVTPAIFNPETGSWAAGPADPAVAAGPEPPGTPRLYTYRGGPPELSDPPYWTAGWVGRYSAAAGWVFDERSGAWIEVPPLAETRHVDERIVASAGRDLLLVGGVRWGPGLEPRLLNEAWIWRAPPG